MDDGSQESSRDDALNLGNTFSLPPFALEREGEPTPGIPEPDLPSFQDRTEGELEDEIAALSEGHLRNLNEIGPRVYWLNEKYKARKKAKGTGVKAFLERIQWFNEAGKVDLNHWRYLVSRYEPEERRRERLAMKKALAARNVTALDRTYSNSASSQSEPPNRTGVINENSIITLEIVRASVKRLLKGLSPPTQLKLLIELGEWICGQVEDLEEELKRTPAG